MRDIFELIDKIKFFRDDSYIRKVVLVFSVVMIFPWVVLGFDSGLGMLEIWKNNWQINYDAYGKTLHFSAFVIYGLLFYGLSSHFSKLGIRQSKNVFYSAFLVIFNIAIFEWFYMASFAYFQMRRNLLEWFINEFLFLQQYLWMLILGVLTLLAFYVDSYTVNDKKVIGRLYRFFPSIEIAILIEWLLCSILLWIYWPLAETVTIGVWSSSRFFPQTHYWNIYVENNFIHLLNVLTKAMFATTQFYILSRFRKEPNESPNRYNCIL